MPLRLTFFLLLVYQIGNRFFQQFLFPADHLISPQPLFFFGDEVFYSAQVGNHDTKVQPADFFQIGGNIGFHIVVGINPRHFPQLLIPIGQQRLYLGFGFVAD